MPTPALHLRWEGHCACGGRQHLQYMDVLLECVRMRFDLYITLCGAGRIKEVFLLRI